MAQLLPILDGRVETPAEIRLPARRIWDQGSVDCCLSCAWASSFEALRPAYPLLSPLFHYYDARVASYENPNLYFNGVEFEPALSCVRSSGISSHNSFPNPRSPAEPITPGDAVRDPASARTDALQYVLGRDAYGLDLCVSMGSNPEQWIDALIRQHPILMVIQPDISYEAMKNGGANSIWLANGQRNLGPTHAVVIIGYFDEVKSFVVQDSRGTSFGRGGQWLLPVSHASSKLVESVFEIGQSLLSF